MSKQRSARTLVKVAANVIVVALRPGMIIRAFVALEGGGNIADGLDSLLPVGADAMVIMRFSLPPLESACAGFDFRVLLV